MEDGEDDGGAEAAPEGRVTRLGSQKGASRIRDTPPSGIG